MNFRSLGTNAKIAWSGRASVPDFVRRMAWVYSRNISAALTPREWIIGFRFPPPVGYVRLCLRSNDGADAFTYSEVFEHEYYRLPLRRSPETILDLGANIGLSTIYFARLFPNSPLACVEPVPENLQLLAHNLELNGVTAEIIAAAVDAEDGVVAMERATMDYAHKIADPTRSNAPLFEVAGISITSILRRLGWRRIGLLKMDIEGHEKVLFRQRCEWLHHVDSMCLEYHHHFADVELARIANKFGFLAPKLLPGHVWLLTRQ